VVWCWRGYLSGARYRLAWGKGREEDGEVRGGKGKGQPPKIFWPRTAPAKSVSVEA